MRRHKTRLMLSASPAAINKACPVDQTVGLMVLSWLRYMLSNIERANQMTKLPEKLKLK